MSGAECRRRARHGRAVVSGGIYILDRIVQPSVPVHDPSMSLPGSRGSKRPADNELYDRGCDLVEAATAIRRLADDPCAGRALPALLGCMETALRELGCAAASMDDTSSRSMHTEALADRVHRGFSNLGLALADAELAATAVRGLAARSVAASGGGRPLRRARTDRPARDLETHHSTPRETP